MRLKKKKPMIYAQETSKVSKKWEDDFEHVGKPQFYVSGSDRGMGYDKSIDKKVDDLLKTIETSFTILPKSLKIRIKK